MVALRALALLVLVAAGSGSRLVAAPQAPVWVAGSLSARLIEAGYTQDHKTGAWEAEVVLRFRDLSPDRRFNQAVQVQFLDAQGKVLGSWKTFLSLSPGEAQHRRVRAPSRLGCPGGLAACPSLRLRLALKVPMEPALAIPARALPEADLPPAATPLYVARVFDGDTFQLLDGQRVRLLGIDAPEMKAKPQAFAREAAEALSQRVMDEPVQLAYDGERHDNYGRVLALVNAADGSCLNLELLQKGLARAYKGADFSRKAEFAAAEARARDARLGLWGLP